MADQRGCNQLLVNEEAAELAGETRHGSADFSPLK
jgi:hypothetical protein